MTTWPARLRNARAFAASDCSSYMTPDPLWPCIHCGGRGHVWAPGSQSCPIEGNKMRDTVTCNACGGKKTGQRAPWVEALKKARENHAANVTRERDRIALIKRALAKLTDEEATVLGWPASSRTQL